MNKCKECNSIIFDSRSYRRIKEELIRLDERFENVVDDLCQNCLQFEKKKFLRNIMLKKILKREIEENKNV